MNDNKQQTTGGICDTCVTPGCIFQSGIERHECDFYMSIDDLKQCLLKSLDEEGVTYIDLILTLARCCGYKPERRSHWVEIDEYGGFKCPECGWEMVGTSKFCPGCGADMRTDEVRAADDY